MIFRLFPYFFLSALFLNTRAISAQIIDNMEGGAFTKEMYFSEPFLKANNVSSITMSYSLKRSGRAIESKPDIKIYKFNANGQLTQIDAIITILTHVDSTHIEIDRNELGLISQRTEASKKGYTSSIFEYDNNGNVIKLENKSCENTSDEKLKLIPGLQFSLSAETFQYASPSAEILQKTSFNNYGLAYAVNRTVRNQAGFILREEIEQTIGGKTTHILYEYNEHGWIANKKTVNPQKPENVIREERFEYDKLGNLLRFKIFQNGKIARDVEIIYSATYFIDAVLDQDMSSKDILIYKFTYQFR